MGWDASRAKFILRPSRLKKWLAALARELHRCSSHERSCAELEFSVASIATAAVCYGKGDNGLRPSDKPDEALW